MSDRARIIQTFLAGSPWAGWAQHPIPGDASARRYLRLTQGADSAILMDAAGDDTAPFVTLSGWLIGAGLCPPDILLSDPTQGLLLISDLGPTLLSDAENPATGYTATVDVLAHLHRQSPPDLAVMTPDVAGDMTRIAATHYARNPDIADDLATLVTDLFAQTKADRIALRDVHAENIVWRAARSGTDRVGLLDFQDAFIAPAGYDLASLLRDARRTLPDSQIATLTAQFVTLTGLPMDSFAPQLALLGAQRNLRILGIFARLATMGKPRYLAHLPRVWAQIQRDTAHPALRPLARWVDTYLTAPKAP